MDTLPMDTLFCRLDSALENAELRQATAALQ